MAIVLIKSDSAGFFVLIFHKTMERLTPTKWVTHIKLDYPLHSIAFVNFQRSTDFSRLK